MNESDQIVDKSVPLPMAEVGLVNKKAQIRGTMVGITGGLICALITRNVLRLSSNVTILSGLASGAGVGYMSVRANLNDGLRQLQRHQSLVGSAARSENEMNALDLRAGREIQHEAGVAGMYDYQDRSHTTRGDH